MVKWGHLSSFHAFLMSYGPKLSIKVHFLQFCADRSQKPKAVKAIYTYGSESSYYSLDMVYNVLGKCS